MSLKIWSYNPGSHTAILLAQRVRGRVLASPEETRFTPRRGDFIINYGNSEFTDRITSRGVYTEGYNLINHPAHVKEFSNKLNAFEHLENECDIATVPWTDVTSVVQSWLDNRFDVVARHTLTGHSGRGIQILTPEEFAFGRAEIPRCRLYTMYVKKSKEWRLHVFQKSTGDHEFLWQQKRRRIDCAEPDWQIRNYENGFIYAVEDVQKPPNYEEIQNQLAHCVDLSFYAVDLLMPNSSNPREIRHHGASILEINSAPGLQSDTLLDWYQANLQERINAAR